MEVLYFVGCYLSYDPRMKKVAAATADILNKAGVEFGILGDKENCCGESIRKTGSEEVFKSLARENIKTFVENGVKKILVSSPHCYHTFKNEYPEFMVNFEVVHASQYVLELINAGRLQLTGEYGKKVTYHDPCYLGRANDIYDEPRQLLQSIPGVELVEMSHHRANGLCCGGGGGGMWLDGFRWEKAKARISEWRVREAVSALGAPESGENGQKARILAVACPYEPPRFEDATKTVPGAESMKGILLDYLMQKNFWKIFPIKYGIFSVLSWMSIFTHLLPVNIWKLSLNLIPILSVTKGITITAAAAPSRN